MKNRGRRDSGSDTSVVVELRLLEFSSKSNELNTSFLET